MSVIISNGKFGSDTWQQEGGKFVPLAEIADHVNDNHPICLDVLPSDDLDEVLKASEASSAVRIDFPSFADGRGFSLAKALREAGFDGVIRAKGHVLCEQYPLALRCGIDQVELDEAMSTRQPEENWVETFNRTQNTYTEHLQANLHEARAV